MVEQYLISKVQDKDLSQKQGAKNTLVIIDMEVWAKQMINLMSQIFNKSEMQNISIVRLWMSLN